MEQRKDVEDMDDMEEMEIRPLMEKELKEAMELRVRGYTEELDGKVENPLSADEELRIWSRWIRSGTDNEPHRILGAFDEDELLGFGAAGPSLEEEHADAMELLLLYVYPGQRGKGVSLHLLQALSKAFHQEGAQSLLIYSHHHAPSNHFYRLLGAKVLRQESQGKEGLLMDVLELSMEDLFATMEERFQSMKKA